eukprot:COSAG05_NODE_922_length_6585_cov_180.946038_2_plen_785_part_00
MHYPHHHWLQHFEDGRALRKLQQWGSVPRRPHWLRAPVLAEGNGFSDHLAVIVEHLRNDSWQVRSAAANTIGCSAARGYKFVQQLLECLTDQDYFVRGSAAAALGRCFHPAHSVITAEHVVSKLVRLLQDQHWLPRKAATRAIGQVIGGDCTGDHILRYSIKVWFDVATMLADMDARVRAAAAESLSHMGILTDNPATGMRQSCLADAAAKDMALALSNEADRGFQLLQTLGWQVGKFIAMAARQWVLGNDRPQVLQSMKSPSLWRRVGRGIGSREESSQAACHQSKGQQLGQSLEKANVKIQNLMLMKNSDNKQLSRVIHREQVLERVLGTFIAEYGSNHSDTCRVRSNLNAIRTARRSMRALPESARGGSQRSTLPTSALTTISKEDSIRERGGHDRRKIDVRWQTSEAAGVSKHHRHISAEIFIQMKAEVQTALAVIFHWLEQAGIEAQTAENRARFSNELVALLRDSVIVDVGEEGEDIVALRASQIQQAKASMFRRLTDLGQLTIGFAQDKGTDAADPRMDYYGFLVAINSLSVVSILWPESKGHLSDTELRSFLDRQPIRNTRNSATTPSVDGRIKLIPRPAGLRAGCCCALGLYGARKASELLTELLQDETELVRNRAAKALRSLDPALISETALLRLAELFENPKWRAQVALDWQTPAAILSILATKIRGVFSHTDNISGTSASNDCPTHYVNVILRTLGTHEIKGGFQPLERSADLRAAALDALGVCGTCIAANGQVATALQRGLTDSTYLIDRIWHPFADIATWIFHTCTGTVQ